MTRPWIISNVKYKNPQASGRGQGIRGLRNLLKYVQYRDNHDQHLPQVTARERWVDCGLGKTYKTILDQCVDERSDQVLAWTWVISPEPDVMELLPENKRTAFMEALTEAVVEEYYEARGFEPIYSYVVHHAQTQDGRPHTHSHVILPGTAMMQFGPRCAMVNYQRQGHLDLLDKIANLELTHLLEQELDRKTFLKWQLGLLDDVSLER